MGCISSCFLVDGDDEHENPNSPGFRCCVCLRCLTQQLMNAYSVLHQRGEVHGSPLTSQGRAPSPSASVAEDSSIPNSYRSPPRPLPYDDPRCSHLHRQREGLRPRHDKASRHSHEESEPFIRSTNSDRESVDTGDRHNGSVCEGSKVSLSESSMKQPAREIASGEACKFYSFEEEDVCPTCLEEYTIENPRITMQCSHHFHLGCIYEWMERSEVCPVCGKVMLFNETT